MRRLILGLAALAVLVATPLRAAEPDYAGARRMLVREIVQRTADISDLTSVPTIAAPVLAAFAAVPRHRFVPPPLIPIAYADTPLPLGHGQNLTQPSLLALMTQVLALKPGERVFETGTDTGYLAAILAELGVEVFSMEIVEPLLDLARTLLPDLGYRQVRLHLGDGYYGWDMHAPYDAMVIKESSFDVPPALWRQLKPGGRMVIPLGAADGPQQLTLVTKNADGSAARRALLPVRFAPFQGGRRIEHMEQRLSLVTLGVADLARSRRFYEALGWKGSGPSDGSVVFFQAGGMIVSLWTRAALVEDSGITDTQASFSGMALAHNVRRKEDVDAVIAEAKAAGAKLLKPPGDVFWGGYTAYFADPDGHVWEIAWNPAFPIAADGTIKLPG